MHVIAAQSTLHLTLLFRPHALITPVIEFRFLCETLLPIVFFFPLYFISSFFFLLSTENAAFPV